MTGAARSAPRRWTQEEGARGTWVVVITEIPWLVQKSAGREDRRAPQREEAAAGRRRQGRVGRRRPPRDRAEIPRGRSRADDGIAVQAHRAREPISLNLNVLIKGKIPKVVGLAECLREWLDHLRDVLVRRSNFRKTRSRTGSRNARRLPDRLSQHRQGDQDHPHRGRAEAGADQGVQAHGSPGRRHPQHAPALLRKLEEWKSAPRTRTFAPSEEPSSLLASEDRAMVQVGGWGAKVRDLLDRRRRSASAARCSPTRPSTISPRSRKPLSSASRTRS